MEFDKCPFHAENWNIRTEDFKIGQKRVTHYQQGVVADAIKLFIDLRQETQQSIFAVCDDLYENNTIQVHWKSIFAEKIWQRFLIDNPIFDTDEISERYHEFPYAFFHIVQSILKDSEHAMAQHNEAEILKGKRTIGMPYSVNDIKYGWAAMIREAGIFEPFEGRLQGISYQLWELQKRSKSLTVNSILGIWHDKMSSGHFINSSFAQERFIICPANQVVPLIGLNISLNLALIHQNKYSRNNPVLLLGDDGTSSFRSDVMMLCDYEDRVYHK